MCTVTHYPVSHEDVHTLCWCCFTAFVFVCFRSLCPCKKVDPHVFFPPSLLMWPSAVGVDGVNQRCRCLYRSSRCIFILIFVSMFFVFVFYVSVHILYVRDAVSMAVFFSSSLSKCKEVAVNNDMELFASETVYLWAK